MDVERTELQRMRNSAGLAFRPLGGPCNPGCKVSVHELAKGVEPGENRGHHLVHLQGIEQALPAPPQ